MARNKTGTKIGLAAATIAVVTAWYWFYLVDEVALPSDRSLFVVLFLLAACAWRPCSGEANQLVRCRSGATRHRNRPFFSGNDVSQ
jgi:hypothetical protein